MKKPGAPMTRDVVSIKRDKIYLEAFGIKKNPTKVR